MKRATVSLLAFAVSVAALVVLVATRNVLGTGPVTIAMQVAAALFMVWARITFGARSFHAAANATEGGLVTSGPYAIVRNPIYAAILVFTAAAVIAHPSLLTVLCGLAIAAGMLVRIFLEERELAQHFGAPYDAYRRRVKRLVPLVY